MTAHGVQNPIVKTGSIPGTGLAFPLTEYRRRVDAVTALFDSFKIDALVVTSAQSQRYLTGYDGSGSYFAPFPLIITASGSVTYVVRSYDEDAVRTDSWVEDVIPYTHQRDVVPALAEALRSARLGKARVGLELGSWNLSPTDVSLLRHNLPEIQIIDATKLVPSIAAVMSPQEIEIMRAAMALTDISIGKFYEFIRPGAMELEAAEAIIDAVAKAGGGTVNVANLLFGERTALPHGSPSAYVLQPDQPAMIEVGSYISGYAAPLVRSAILGHHAGVEGLHKLAEEALGAAIEAIRPGVQMGDVDDAARRVVSEAGQSNSFLHRVGYQIGIGWSYRGNFSLEPDATDVISQGMIFHLPFILFHRGQYATGPSQSVLVTETGAEPLSSTSPELFHVD
jgi:Xaa-Pro dipeptidase